MGFFLCFAAGLWAWLRQYERDPAPISACFAFGALALTALIFAGFAPGGIAAYRADDPDLSAAVAGNLSDLTFYLLALSGIPTAIALGAYAALVFGGAPLPQWTAWLAIVGAAGHVLIAASLLWDSGFLSLEGDIIVFVPATYFAWILAAGACLMRAPAATER